MCDALESRHDTLRRLAELQSQFQQVMDILNKSSTAQRHNVNLLHVCRCHYNNSPDETKEIQTLKTLMRQQSWLWKMML